MSTSWIGRLYIYLEMGASSPVSFRLLKWIQVPTTENGALRCGVEMVLMCRRKTGGKGVRFVTSPMGIWVALVPRMVLPANCRNICGNRTWSSRTLPCELYHCVWVGLLCKLTSPQPFGTMDVKIRVYILVTEQREVLIFCRGAEVWSLLFLSQSVTKEQPEAAKRIF